MKAGSSAVHPRWTKSRSLMVGPAAVAAVLAMATSDAVAQTDRALAGRLSCTAEAPEPNSKFDPGDLRAPATEVEVSCTYEPSTGPPSKFTGTIGHSGGTLPDEKNRAEKRVYIWLVHGPAGLSPANLSGIFTRTEPPAPGVRPGFEQSLISADGTIALMPPTGTDQTPGNAALTILELTLSAVRV